LLGQLSLSFFLLEHVLSLLSLHASILAFLVVSTEVLAPLLLLLNNLIGNAIKLFVLDVDLVNQFLVLLNIFDSSILDLLEKSDILRLNFLLLGLMVLDELLHLSDLHL
jgi:hypothetical protein